MCLSTSILKMRIQCIAFIIETNEKKQHCYRLQWSFFDRVSCFIAHAKPIAVLFILFRFRFAFDLLLLQHSPLLRTKFKLKFSVEYVLVSMSLILSEEWVFFFIFCFSFSFPFFWTSIFRWTIFFHIKLISPGCMGVCVWMYRGAVNHIAILFTSLLSYVHIFSCFSFVHFFISPLFSSFLPFRWVDGFSFVPFFPSCSVYFVETKPKEKEKKSNKNSNFFIWPV